MYIAFAILSVLFSAFSNFSKAICDLSEEGKLNGNPMYWYKDSSWGNKWKNWDKSQGEKFFGSSRWFVVFTDAWHLFNDFRDIGTAICYCLIGVLIVHSAWYWFLLFNYPFGRLIFHLFYNSKKLRK